MNENEIYDYLLELVDDYIASFDEDIDEVCGEWNKDKAISSFVDFLDTELLFREHCKRKKDSNPTRNQF